MDSEEYRTGSAESENSSDNSYVQVSKDDVQEQQLGSREESPSSLPPLPDAPLPNIPAGSEDEDIYTFDEGDSTMTAPVQTTSSDLKVLDDPTFIESHDPEEEKEPTSSSMPITESETLPIKSSSIEDVQQGSVSTCEGCEAPKATGLLSFLNLFHPAVLCLLYWKDVKMSAVIFGGLLVILLTLTLNTFIHTLILLLLSFLVVSLTYIVTKIAIDSFYNREIRNPFSDYLNRKITLPEDKIIEWTQYFVTKLDGIFNLIVRLLLFDNIKQSLKFGVALWLASFVTNHLTLLRALSLLVILLFAVPPIYSKYQDPIDEALKNLCNKLCEVFKMVKSRIPYMGKKKSD